MIAAALIAGCGGGGGAPAPTTTTAAPATTIPAPSPTASPALAVGLTEANPHLLAPGPQPPAFTPWRDRVVALKPAYIRVLVDWARLQPAQAQPPDATLPNDGCMRGMAPCAPYAGLRDTLRAVAALGAQPVLVLYGTPPWAARRVAGCERPGTTSYQRMPGLGDYRAFVRWLLDLGRSLRIDLPWWSAWNEPNVPGFLNPQRRRCGDHRAAPVAPGLYASMVRALTAELDRAPGDQRIVLGDAAGVPEGRPASIGSAEFVRHLPDDLVCGAAAWAQHLHLVRPRGGGKRIEPVAPAHTDGLLADVEQALDGHHCAHPVPVWVTETGVGDAPGGCEKMGHQLERWADGGRVRAAFQYSMRQDPLFPVGLADAQLTTVFPAYDAWRARGAGGC